MVMLILVSTRWYYSAKYWYIWRWMVQYHLIWFL